MNEDRLRELFKEMRDEPLPANSLARVRMRVAKRTASSFGWWRVAAMVAVAACVVVAVFVAQKPDPVPPPAPAVAVVPKPVLSERPPQRPATIAKPAPVQAVRRRVQPPASRQDVVIRIETPDPNVVLFFLADAAGE